MVALYVNDVGTFMTVSFAGGRGNRLHMKYNERIYEATDDAT